MVPPQREEGHREFDQLRHDLGHLMQSHESLRTVVVDLQVRVAQIETKEPIGKDEFHPVKRLVWGFVTTVLAVVLVAILALVVTKVSVGRIV